MQILIVGVSDVIRRRVRFIWLVLGLLSALGKGEESSGARSLLHNTQDSLELGN